MASAPQFPFTLLAFTVRTRGLRGEIICDLLTDFPEKFADRKRLFLLTKADADAERADRAREVTLQDHWMPTGKLGGRIILKFAGYNRIEEAEKLLKMYVAIPLEERAPLQDGEYYISDLIGCEIATKDGTIGRVLRVDNDTTAVSLLVVESPAGEEILVPLVRAYVANADMAARRIEMRLPDGLLEINRPEPKATRKNKHMDETDSSLRSE